MNSVLAVTFLSILASCHTITDYSKVPRTKGQAIAGKQVSKKGVVIPLHEGQLNVGDDLQPILAEISPAKLVGKVTIINVVPSIDTSVCEAQSHILSESPKVAAGIQRITISRDTPMAQQRFQKEASLDNMIFASDFSFGKFGKKTGLLMTPNQLLARAVLVTNKQGEVVHLHISDDITKLPDMEAAIAKANSLLP